MVRSLSLISIVLSLCSILLTLSHTSIDLSFPSYDIKSELKDWFGSSSYTYTVTCPDYQDYCNMTTEEEWTFGF